MPKTTPQRIVFTCLGVLLMATTMAIYNKYLVYGAFSVELFKQVAIAFCQKAPLAFMMLMSVHIASEKMICWINTDENIISFHFVEGFVRREFPSKSEMISFCFNAVNRGYKLL